MKRVKKWNFKELNSLPPLLAFPTILQACCCEQEPRPFDTLSLFRHLAGASFLLFVYPKILYPPKFYLLCLKI